VIDCLTGCLFRVLHLPYCRLSYWMPLSRLTLDVLLTKTLLDYLKADYQIIKDFYSFWLVHTNISDSPLLVVQFQINIIFHNLQIGNRYVKLTKMLAVALIRHVHVLQRYFER